MLRGLWILCAGFAVAGCGPVGETEAARWRLAPTTFEVGGFTDDARYSLSEVMGATEAEWVVFDGGGAMVGRLAVPLATTLLELGADYAIVVEADAFDVETVRVMQLVK